MARRPKARVSLFRLVLVADQLIIRALTRAGEVTLQSVQQALMNAQVLAADVFRALVYGAIGVIGIPLVMLALGIAFHDYVGWLVPAAGLVATISLGAVLFALTGIVDVVSRLYQLVKGGTSEAAAKTVGQAMVRGVMIFLLGEMIVVWYATIIPVWRDPWNIPTVLMIALALVLIMNVWKFKPIFPHIALWSAVTSFIYFTIRFFFPLTFGVIERKVPAVDEKTSRWLQDPSLPSFGLSIDSPWVAIGGLITVVVVGYLLFKSTTKTWQKALIATIWLPLMLFMLSQAAHTVKGADGMKLPKVFGEKLPSPALAAVNPDGSLVIPATVVWVDAGKVYREGEVVEWRMPYANVTATDNPSDPAYGYVDANGWRHSQFFDAARPHFVDGCPTMALVGRVGKDGDWFCMKSEGRHTAPRTGNLYVAFNDAVGHKEGQFKPEFFRDNAGEGVLYLN